MKILMFIKLIGLNKEIDKAIKAIYGSLNAGEKILLCEGNVLTRNISNNFSKIKIKNKS